VLSNKPRPHPSNPYLLNTDGHFFCFIRFCKIKSVKTLLDNLRTSSWHEILPLHDVYITYYYFLNSWGRMRLSHLVRRSLTGLLYHPRSIDNECGAVGGMRIGKRNRSTLRKAAPVPLCSPQIPHDLTQDRLRTAEVGIRRSRAWATARPEAYKPYEVVKRTCSLNVYGKGP
jgi:hypothetical protein